MGGPPLSLRGPEHPEAAGTIQPGDLPVDRLQISDTAFGSLLLSDHQIQGAARLQMLCGVGKQAVNHLFSRPDGRIGPISEQIIAIRPAAS